MESRHNLDTGDLVKFTEVKGMTELNMSEPRQVKVIDRYSFSIGDTSHLTEYTGGGKVTEYRRPLVLTYKPLSESFRAPQFTLTDFAKAKRPPLLHLAFHTLHKYVERYSELPKPRCQEDIKNFVAMATELSVTSSWGEGELDVDLLREFASSAAGNLAPMQSVIGGITAQEVMKACSGKFTPIHQWLYFDAMECVQQITVHSQCTQLTCAPRSSRYDGQIAVFGEEFQQKLSNAKYFLVGAGAVGCEMLKNWSMIGLG